MQKKRTIRRMPPIARKLAHELNNAEKAIKAIRRLLPMIAEKERDSKALFQANKKDNAPAFKKLDDIFNQLDNRKNDTLNNLKKAMDDL